MKSKLITQALLNYRNNGGTLPLVEAYKIIKNMNFAEGGDLPESGLPEKNSTIVDADNNRQGSLLTGMMKARMAIAAQMGNTSAQRMTSVYPNRYEFTGNEQINGENIGVPKGAFGTHFMASMDEYAVPFIQERNNKLQFVSNPRYNDAESMRFESPEDAQYFAEHYKDIAPMMQSFATGGELPEDPPVTNLSNYIRDTSSSNDNTNYKSIPLRMGEPPIIGGTLPTVEIKASNTPKNYRNDPISRREDIKKIPITKSNMHDYPVSVQNEFMKQQVADRPGYEGVKDFANFAATGFGLAPIGILDDVVRGAVGVGGKYLPRLKGYKEIKVPQKQFKSEIDWGKWNSEIPSNKPLMDEYLQIEKTAKQNGTWMKNSDGSAFQGTPEQFVQQQSSNFKKAFPDILKDSKGNILRVNHGSPEKFTEFDKTKFASTTDQGDKGVGTYVTPLDYSKNYGHNEYNLYVNAKSPINASNFIDPSIPISARAHLADKYLRYFHRNIPEKLKNRVNQYLDKDIVIGDEFYPNVNEKAFEMVVPFNNRMKSAIGNNGMFDMTNPNIYKGLIPTIGTYGLTQNKKE